MNTDPDSCKTMKYGSGSEALVISSTVPVLSLLKGVDILVFNVSCFLVHCKPVEEVVLVMAE